MSSLALMQPYFFPYLGYYQLVHSVDRFLLYDHLAFIKQGWINRNRLLAVGRDPFFITVPVSDISSNRSIRDSRIGQQPWRKAIAGSLESNYRRAPHYDTTMAIVGPTLDHDTESISELAALSVTTIADALGIETEIVDRPEHAALEADLAVGFDDIQLDDASPRLARPIALCRHYDADVFINPAGGGSLYPREQLARNGIDVYLLAMDDVSYPQLGARPGHFEPNLSIIDVLMNCGIDRTRRLLDAYTLMS